MSKIVRVEIELANLPPLVERTNSVRTMSLQETPLVRIVDADGIVGVGYSWTHGAGGSSLVALLRDHLAPRLLGQEADRIEAIWQDLFRATHALAIGPVTSLAIAAIDVALWDLKGKRSGQSLWRMAGGAKQKLPAYTTDGGWLQFDVPTMVANAERTREQSFRGTKLKVGKPTLAEDLARLRAVRKALGDGWHHSAWGRRKIIHAAADKAHVDTLFVRYRADGSVIGSFESMYVLTKEQGRWGVKLRSSYAP